MQPFLQAKFIISLYDYCVQILNIKKTLIKSCPLCKGLMPKIRKFKILDIILEMSSDRQNYSSEGNQIHNYFEQSQPKQKRQQKNYLNSHANNLQLPPSDSIQSFHAQQVRSENKSEKRKQNIQKPQMVVQLRQKKQLLQNQNQKIEMQLNENQQNEATLNLRKRQFQNSLIQRIPFIEKYSTINQKSRMYYQLNNVINSFYQKANESQQRVYRKKGTKVNQAEKDQIIKLKKENYTIKKIKQRVNIAETTIKNILKQSGETFKTKKIEKQKKKQ